MSRPDRTVIGTIGISGPPLAPASRAKSHPADHRQGPVIEAPLAPERAVDDRRKIRLGDAEIVKLRVGHAGKLAGEVLPPPTLAIPFRDRGEQVGDPPARAARAGFVIEGERGHGSDPLAAIQPMLRRTIWVYNPVPSILK